MRKQHHYTTEQAILDKIDGQKERARSLNTQAEMLESLYKSHEVLTCCFIKCRKKARRIEETTLPELGEALSEFRTAPMMPITGNNLSVVGPLASL